VSFLDSLLSHYVFDEGRLVVAHAGLIEKYHGRASRRVRDFCLYGDTTGETDEYGLPVRRPWANEYRGRAMVVYGHTPTPEVEPINNTYCIDTGCVFGGKLTALRYPEKDIVQVPAAREYYPPIRPFLTAPPPAADVLSIDDVQGQRLIETRLRRTVKIGAEHAAAALEVMGRFAADPRWLLYLPPTMSPCETSARPDYLEYPTEAFDYYRAGGVGTVVCEEKHMGSRAVMVVCRDTAAAARRFRVDDGRTGIIHTRTGRHFFDDVATEEGLLERVRGALTAHRFWEDFATDWVLLDTELMPWSAKAQGLIVRQYAPVGRAGRTGLAAAAEALSRAIATAPGEVTAGALDLAATLARYQAREAALAAYTDAYRRYCWPVRTLDDYRIAPFHILATEGTTYFDTTHVWQMDTITAYLTGTDPIVQATNQRLVDLADEASVAAGAAWWEGLTATGGEGMVVKPLDYIATKGTQLLQPAVKCRGREYLRIIYGPEYLLAGNLERLKNRSLSSKRGLALSEFALGVESVERFVAGEPAYRVHEPVFGVLAMESQPVDPRL